MDNAYVANATRIKNKLNSQHDTIGLSWHKLARIYNIPCSTLWDIARGKPIPSIHYLKLGLEPPEANIHIIAGIVPNGSVSLGALQCKCGQWFISNHPCRKYCFICSPYKQRSK